MKQSKIKSMVISSLLVALSFIIATVGPGLTFLPPPFTVTFASHVPTMIACFIDPYTAILTAIGSAAGFLIKLPPPTSVVVAFRALSHIMFSMFIIFSMRKGMNRYVSFSIAGLIHAACEAVIVAVSVPFVGLPDNTSFLRLVLYTTFFVTILHHIVDSAMALAGIKALESGKLISSPKKKAPGKANP